MSLTDFNQLPLPECVRLLIPDDVVLQLMETAFGEDGFAEGDITTVSIIPEGRDVEATFVARQPGVVAGLSILQRATGLSPIDGRRDRDNFRSHLMNCHYQPSPNHHQPHQCWYYS